MVERERNFEKSFRKWGTSNRCTACCTIKIWSFQTFAGRWKHKSDRTTLGKQLWRMQTVLKVKSCHERDKLRRDITNEDFWAVFPTIVTSLASPQPIIECDLQLSSAKTRFNESQAKHMYPKLLIFIGQFYHLDFKIYCFSGLESSNKLDIEISYRGSWSATALRMQLQLQL